MAELNDETKLRIVLALARFGNLADISKELGKEGVSCDLRQIGSYDPTRTYYEAGERWEKIFKEERARFLTVVQDVPIANQAYRLNILQQNLDGALRSGNKVLANATLEQAAKEVGGAMTNERNINVSKAPLEELTPEERRAMLADLIRKALEQADPAGTVAAPAGVQ